MTQVTPHVEELAEAIRQSEVPPAIPEDDFPIAVNRVTTLDIEDDYLDPTFIEELREGGVGNPRYRSYLRWRRMQVARLTARKWTQQDMADRLGVSAYTIARDQKALLASYENIAQRDWAILVEERVLQLDVDIVEMRRLMDSMPSQVIETEEGPVAIGMDVDQRLRIFDRVMALEARRDKLLGIDQAASRQHVETKKLQVSLSFDQPGRVEAEMPVIDIEPYD